MPIAADGADAGFTSRKARYLESLPPDVEGSFGAVARYWKGQPVDVAGIRKDLDHVRARKDCSDFKMAGFLRLLYLDRQARKLPADVRREVESTTLNFKYWIDEPGHDSMCYWSENHQILYHSAEYLAGALFPDEVFPNSGMTGREHMEKGRRLMERWFSWRERFGFSEWFSNVYYEEDIYPLLNLVDFAPDAEIRERAAMIVDQLALNMALNSFRGYFSCTHGRTYEKNMLSARGDSTKQIFYVWWGEREFTSYVATPNSGGIAAATSSYELPPAIYNIGVDKSAMENYQSHGINIDDAPDHGISHDELDTGMFFWGMGMYTHHRVGDLTTRMWDEYDLYENVFFLGFAKFGVAMSNKGWFEPFLEKVRTAPEAAFLHDTNTYTYRTSDYMLSSTLDRFPGDITAQEFSWSATLGRDAIVFTTYPGKIIVGGSPGRWEGNASAPRVAQHKNVLVAIYNAPLQVALGELYRLPYTHAWFPRAAFDEVVQDGHWVFGRKGSGYVALYSHSPMTIKKSGPYAGNELMAMGRRNVWICEMGSEKESGSFKRFISEIVGAGIEVDGTQVSYDSPSRGRVEFDWRGAFMVAGEEVPLRRDMRYDNPYMKTRRFPERIEVNAGGDRLILDFENNKRIMEK